MKRCAVVVSVLALGYALAGLAVAEEAVAVSPESKVAQEPAPTLVRVLLVLARYQGEQKTASVPYALVASADRSKVQLRMGVEVPIAVGTANNSTSFQYKNVGTNIDCRVRTSLGDRYLVELWLENSSIYRRSGEDAAARDAAIVSDRPMFRTFNVQLSLALRDGQTLQTVAATDPVSGEVVKIDVTLNVVK